MEAPTRKLKNNSTALKNSPDLIGLRQNLYKMPKMLASQLQQVAATNVFQIRSNQTFEAEVQKP